MAEVHSENVSPNLAMALSYLTCSMYFENALTLGLYPTQIDWGMQLLYTREGLQMNVLSPKRGGNDFVMALPSKILCRFIEFC
jgi:hypothetical protein